MIIIIKRIFILQKWHKCWKSQINYTLEMHERVYTSTSYLQIAEMNHAIHHLTNTEAVTKVVERVVTVVLLNCQLKGRKLFIHWAHCRVLN